MFKHELPLIFPDDAGRKAVAEAMFDPFEYFVLRDKDGLLQKDFKQPLGKVSYHIPCHSRVQNVGPEDPRGARVDSRHDGHTRSSAARATTAPTASSASTSRIR